MKHVLRLGSLPLLALILFVLFVVCDVGSAASEAWMNSHVRSQGMWGVALYVGLVTLLTAVGVPRQLCAILGGYVFGMWWGALWATLGTALACCLCFCYARFLGQEWLQGRYGKTMAPFNAFLCQSPFLLTFVVRIVPLGSNFLTNFLAGMSRIPALPFLGGSCAGFTVQNLIFAMLGSGVHMASWTQTAYSGLLYVLSLSLGYWLYAKYRASRRTAPTA